MRCFISTCHNPYYNLSAEEYFLKNSNEEIFMLYINEPSIVIGKHQNLLSEINLRFVNENNIKLARRISGGGTVYQDLNNLNFSFIHNCKNLDQLNFNKFTLPILEFLIDIGLRVKFSGRNDLIIDNQKISGNAMHIYKSRVLSHGTLLFNANLKNLSNSLNNNTLNYSDKSIKSVKSKVDNILNYLDSSKTINEFMEDLFNYIIRTTNSSYQKLITDQEKKLIYQISKEKFDSWDWIYGYSPKYVFQNNFMISHNAITIKIAVEKGIISDTQIKIDQEGSTIYHHALKILVNTKHDFKTISKLLKTDKIINSDTKFNVSEFCYHLF